MGRVKRSIISLLPCDLKLAHSTSLRARFVFLISPNIHFHIFNCYKRAYVDLSFNMQSADGGKDWVCFGFELGLFF